MAQEYNSELIYKLYDSKEAEEAIPILEEMDEIKDNVFLYPIYAAYLKYKNTFYSHFFIDSLNIYESNETVKIATKITKSPCKDTDFIWSLPIFTKYNHFNDEIIKKCLYILDQSSNKKTKLIIEDYHLEKITNFLLGAGKTKEIISNFRIILASNYFAKNVRNTVLKFLLKIDTVPTFDLLISDFQKFDPDLQTLISKQIITWKGPKTEILKKLIKETGTPRAIEIIETYEKKIENEKQKEEISKKQQETEEYGNTKIVLEISSLRTNVNYLALANEKLKTELISKGENLMCQIKTIKDQSSLIEACINLRSVILSINEKIVIPNPIDTNVLSKILPGLRKEELNKSLNKLCVFLYLNGIKVDSSLFGIRSLNQTVSLIGAHNDETEELIDLLKKQNLFEDFSNKNWDLLHKKILQMYKDSLTKMSDSLK